MDTGNPSPDHCLKDGCHAKTRKKDVDMIRCIICCVRHHAECVSVPKDQTNQIWTCFICRQLTWTVNELKKELATMHLHQTEMMNLIKEINLKLKEEKEMKDTAVEKLKTVEKDLVKLNEKMEKPTSVTVKENDTQTDFVESNQNETQTDSVATLTVKELRQNETQTVSFESNQNETRNDTVASLTPSAPTLPSLLLGTSLLRNVDPNKLKDWEVIAKGGATVDDLHTILSNIPEEKHFNKLTIVAGSIDIEKKKIDDIITDYLALTVTATHKADTIAICGILPRTDKDLTEKTSKLNEELRKTCQDTGHEYLEVDDTFYLRNGKVNSACLLQDGLHLTKYGVDNLVKSCHLALKQDVESAYIEKWYVKETIRENTLFKGHTCPLSNFYPVNGLYVEGIPFTTTEAAYVYKKALFHGDKITAENVKKCRTGIHAKRLGDKIHTTPAWQQKKIDIMDNLIRIKLKTCSATRKTLKDSGDRHLIEDTGNSFWGRGTDNKGQNMLGRMWMLYRKKLSMFEPSRTWATRENQPRCHRCAEHGHLIDQCRQQNNMICWKCRSTGHKQKYCHQFNVSHSGFSR